MDTPEIAEVDPFDLPETLGTGEVVWAAETGLISGHRVVGALSASGVDPVPCDLLAVDEAYPEPVAPTAWRARAHQAWRHGEVLLGHVEGRLVLSVPGTRFDADLVLDALGRLAKAVGAHPDEWSARLRIGVERPHRRSSGR